MHIFVRQNNGNGYEVQLDESYNIEQMFFQLSQFYNQKPQNYRFFFAGKQLKNFKTSFNNLKIGDNSIIHIQKKQQLVASTNSSRQIVFNLSIFSYQNQTIIVSLPSNDKVLKIKHKIYQLLKIHPKQQTLVFQGKKLQDNIQLRQTNIKNNSMISLIVNRKQSFIESSEHEFLQSPQLLQSITSLHHKSSQNSKTSLFRSDSINKKQNTQTEPIQVQIKLKKTKFDFIDLGASVQSNTQNRFQSKNINRNQKQCLQMYQLKGLQEEEQFCFQNEQQQFQQQESAYKKLQIDFFETPTSQQNILSSDSQKKTFSKISQDKFNFLSMNPELSKIDQDYEDLNKNIEIAKI